MQTSDSIAHLVEALSKAQGEFTPVPKNKTGVIYDNGREREYRYADLSDMLKMALPILAKHGLVLTQPLIRTNEGQRLCTRILHSSGEWMESDGITIPDMLSPQEFGKVHTYWRRYDVGGLLAIAPDEDVDGVSAEAKPDRKAPRNTDNGKTREFWPSAKKQMERTIAANLITGAQRQRLFAIKSEHGWSDKGLKNILASYGVTSTYKIPKEIYDKVCAELEARKVDEQPEEQPTDEQPREAAAVTGTDGRLPFTREPF